MSLLQCWESYLSLSWELIHLVYILISLGLSLKYPSTPKCWLASPPCHSWFPLLCITFKVPTEVWHHMFASYSSFHIESSVSNMSAKQNEGKNNNKFTEWMNERNLDLIPSFLKDRLWPHMTVEVVNNLVTIKGFCIRNQKFILNHRWLIHGMSGSAQLCCLWWHHCRLVSEHRHVTSCCTCHHVV